MNNKNLTIKHVLLYFSLLIYSCGVSQNDLTPNRRVVSNPKSVKTQPLTDNEKSEWIHKDIIEDTIPGISLEKAYNTIIKNKKGNEVIVAVIDTKLNIFHEDLKNQIWVNKDEIPNNGIDDDKNGYVDDINGWNFLGNAKGEDTKYQPTHETIRIEHKYKKMFEGKVKSDINQKNQMLFALYKKAKIKNLETKKEYSNYLNNHLSFRDSVAKARVTLKDYFPKGEYTIENLKKIDTVGNKLKSPVTYLINFEKYIKEDEILDNYIEDYRLVLKSNEIDYNERFITGDDINDINDNAYGNNIIDGDVPFKHAISVSGVLACTRDNNIGIQGISNQIKIMPVVMVAKGEEHDKDIALAIRYAVDNGAKIINMSWGKFHSINKPWVNDALIYAAKNNVLMVTAAGNYNKNVDIDIYYPSDTVDNIEFVDNFLSIGASTYNLDKKLKASFSSYGKEQVDIFAPGSDVYTAKGQTEYKFSSGTSLASPIVAGVAALILSYYPNLSVPEVKNIILDSGVSYNVNIDIELEDGSKKTIPFNQLSKSGKIVNAYNALIMAETISRAKR